jgi:hypothetical protein
VVGTPPMEDALRGIARHKQVAVARRQQFEECPLGAIVG